jgi:RNA polymerase sigma-70 factor (ECF subfamily)
MTNNDRLTTSADAPVADNLNSITARPRGPVLLREYPLLEKPAHQNRECIPERTVSPGVVNTRNKRPPSIPLLRASADEEDAAIVAAAQSGDGHAFEVLVERHQSRIRAVAWRFARVREDTEDIAQQTFQQAFIHLKQFEGNSSFSTWLTRIAINQSLLLVRKKRASREVPIHESSAENEPSFPLDPPDPGPSPEDHYSQREWKQILSRAINELSPEIRTAVELRDLDELSMGETAGIMRVSVAAVKARLFHGRKKLRVKLKRYVESMSSPETKQCQRVVRPRAFGHQLACSARD